MTHREKAPVGAPCWIDLMTSDTDRARGFYGGVLGWGANEGQEEFGGYFTFTKDGTEIAGGMANQAPGQNPDTWVVYLSVEDAHATAAAAAANGATMLVEPMAVGDLGVMGVMLDPGGAAIGFWQAREFGGFSQLNEDWTPCHFELHTREYERSLDFYRTVFGWNTQTVGDTDEFRYTLAVDNGENIAAVMDASMYLPDGASGQWAIYFGVPDTGPVLEEIVKLGGSVVQPAEDTPYGWLATAADPSGAEFRLVAPNEQMLAR